MNKEEFIKNFYNLDEINLKSRQLKNLYRILNNCIKNNLFNKIDNLKQILYNAYFLNKKEEWKSICPKIGGYFGGEAAKNSPNFKLIKGHIPWNKGTKGLIKGWCKGKNKYNDERLMKISLDRIGDKNPMHHSKRTYKESSKEKQSKIMKNKILEGSFTPNTENRLIHKKLIYDNKKFRSSWEVLFYYFNKNLEYETKRIEYSLNNKKHVYIADFYDSITNTIYEIKPNRILYLQKDKYNCIKESCISNGYNFIHIGDDYFNNIKIPENCDINEEIIKMFKKCIKGIKNEN